MERLHVAAALGVVLATSLACKNFAKKDDTSEPPVTTATPATEDTASASASAAESASAAPTDSTAAAATVKAPPTVKLEDCGERFAAPARVDGKCADYCGVGYTCAPNETCTQTSWPTKAGVRNAAVCAPKGVALRAPVAGAAWDSNAPAFAAAAASGSAASSAKPAASASASAKPATGPQLATPAATVDGVDLPEGKKCPPGWDGIPSACARPCTTDKDCHGKNKCQKLGKDHFCDSQKWD